jgi:threonine dehydrogenase-like Zn-dependent dehydrogenase
MQGVRKAQICLGDSAVVMGLGIIGNISGQLARLCGATEVVGIDPIEFKRDLAKECGYDWTAASVSDILKGTYKDGRFEVVLDVTGAPEAVPEALEAAQLFGRVVLSGSTRGITKEVNFYKHVHCKGLTIIGAHNFRRPAIDDMFVVKPSKTDQRVTMQLLANKRLMLKPLLSDKVPAKEAPKAYERLAAKREKLITIALDWT